MKLIALLTLVLGFSAFAKDVKFGTIAPAATPDRKSVV